jgi:two-component sensor histidine kinase
MKKPSRPIDASEAEKLRKQRAALARFGQHALRTNDLDELLHKASVNVSEAMEIELVKVLQLMPDGKTMLVRAGVNWNPGVVGHATFGAHSQSPAGYALHTDKPVISPDVALEKRFEIPELLWQHGVNSMVNVVIRGDREPFGVLEVDSRQKRHFDEEDISFLHTYANLLASAVDRLTTHRELEEAAETSAILVRELQHRVMNILANIGALARRTRANSANLDDFMKAFESRLGALGRAQDLLTRGSMRGAGIRELLSRELSAHGVDEGKRVTVQGAEIQLPPKFLQALSILFHELATNAVKHGALGVDNGRIEVLAAIKGGERDVVGLDTITAAGQRFLDDILEEPFVAFRRIETRRREQRLQVIPHLLGGRRLVGHFPGCQLYQVLPPDQLCERGHCDPLVADHMRAPKVLARPPS